MLLVPSSVAEKNKCAIRRRSGAAPDSEPVRKFAAFTADLNELADWLNRCGIDTVAMESTGVYWIPICHINEFQGVMARPFLSLQSAGISNAAETKQTTLNSDEAKCLL